MFFLKDCRQLTFATLSGRLMVERVKQGSIDFLFLVVKFRKFILYKKRRPPSANPH